MSKIFGGSSQTFIEPAAVPVQPAAVAADAAPSTDIRTGSAEAEGTAGDLLRKYRPTRVRSGLGAIGTGTGLSL